MNCAEFHRWLDEGMPERDSADAKEHARACDRCAASLEAAHAIEAVLSREALASRIAPVRAPATLVPGVMARVHASEPLQARTVVDPASRWWVRLLSDPVATVSVTVALLMLGLLLWSPAWVLQAGGWVATHWVTWIALAEEAPVDPTVWLAVLATAIPFALWGFWLVGRQERVESVGLRV